MGGRIKNKINTDWRKKEFHLRMNELERLLMNVQSNVSYFREGFKWEWSFLIGHTINAIGATGFLAFSSSLLSDSCILFFSSL